MGKVFKLKNIVSIFLFFILFSSLLGSKDDKLQEARSLFLKGKYQEAINFCNLIETVDSYVLQSRIISIHTYFYKNGEHAEKEYLKAYNIAKKAIKNGNLNANAYVEAAHALGRYGQEIGILHALSKGIADRVKKYLTKALSLHNENIIANISMGMWHAEVLNQAGRTIGKVVYGADIEKARFFFAKAYELNNQQIGLLYELSYGYSLLGEEKDILRSNQLIEELFNIDNFSHMDSLYKKKANKLKIELEKY